jgi:ankyrin repeat protein
LDRYGFTALHQAAYDGYLPIVNILRAKPDIDKNAKEDSQRLHFLKQTLNNNYFNIKQLLAESSLEITKTVEAITSSICLDRGNRFVVYLLLVVPALNRNVTNKDN